MLSTVQSRVTKVSCQKFVKYFSMSSVACEKYDVVVVGGGPGGYISAVRAAQLGLKTAFVESRGSLGGTCFNVGGIPSRALLHKVVKSQTSGIEMFFKNSKVTYIKGFGKLAGPNSVSVDLTAGGSQTVEAKNIILAVGSEVSPLPTAVVDNAGKRIVDSTGALDLTEVPKKLVVVGGGVIGLEMGSVWRRLGSEVTVVEFLDTITPGMDKEITQAFLKILKKQGFNFMLNTKVTGTKVEGNGVKLTVEPSAGGAATQLDADVVLVSTGRRPFTKNIGLEALGIETDKIGRIKVDHHFQTKVPSIFAIGDAIDGPMLAHKAEEEGIACVENISSVCSEVMSAAAKISEMFSSQRPVNYGTIPEVASVCQTKKKQVKTPRKIQKEYQYRPLYPDFSTDEIIRGLSYIHETFSKHCSVSRVAEGSVCPRNVTTESRRNKNGEDPSSQIG